MLYILISDFYLYVDEFQNFITDAFSSILSEARKYKLNLIIAAKRKGVKVISSMGAGGKMEAAKVKVSDISKTENCFLARTIKRRLKEVKIDKGVKVVFSSEIQDESSLKTTDGKNFKKSFYNFSIFFLYFESFTVIYQKFDKHIRNIMELNTSFNI